MAENAYLKNRRSRKGRISCFFALASLLTLSSLMSLAQSSSGIPDESGDRLRLLAQKIQHGNTDEKRDALFEIRNIRSAEASRVALQVLKDGEQIVRATAAASVVFLPGPEAVQALVPLLNDKAEFVRREAAYALGDVGSDLAAAPLIRLLQSEKILEVRAAVVVALGKVGDPSAVSALASLLKSRPNEDNEFLRRSAARSIGQIAQIIRTGKRRVVTPEDFLPEKDKEISAAPQADPTTLYPQFQQAVAVLIDMIKNRGEAEDTRREAAFALGAIGSDSSVAVLRNQLSSSDPYLAEIAREALNKVKIPGPNQPK